MMKSVIATNWRCTVLLNGMKMMYGVNDSMGGLVQGEM
jgi:hypothetical protein